MTMTSQEVLRAWLFSFVKNLGANEEELEEFAAALDEYTKADKLTPAEVADLLQERIETFRKAIDKEREALLRELADLLDEKFSGEKTKRYKYKDRQGLKEKSGDVNR